MTRVGRKSGWEANGALATLFDLLADTVGFGRPIVDGDTVGRRAREHLAVRHVASPLAEGRHLRRVDVP